MQKWRYFPTNKTIIQLVWVAPFIMGALLLLSCTSSNIAKQSTQLSMLPVSDSHLLPQVIKSLLDQADTLYLQGRYTESLAALERAVRIKPRHAEIWSRMAQVYYKQNKFQQAEQHARRSNSYIQNNQPLKNYNDNLIQNAVKEQ